MQLSAHYTARHGLGRVAVCATFLGIVFGVHLYSFVFGILDIIWRGNSSGLYFPIPWSLYIVSLSLFHMSEFFLVAQFNKLQLSADSFLLNHSKEYHIALAASFCEYWLGMVLFPNWKGSSDFDTLTLVGICGTIIMYGGQLIRITAMMTAGFAFTHLVENTKRDGHVVITHGIYAYLRHPGYFGWAWWCVGSQILLRNYICIPLYLYAAIRFFTDRIPSEEQSLVQMFGDEYVEYAQKTPIGIPFVKSHITFQGKKYHKHLS